MSSWVENAMGGKTARACDSCITKRARWYCAADDAFLCQPCDSSVHSANPLARRHERVRLKTASFGASPEPVSAPSWHHGFRKKARTPRQAKPNNGSKGQRQTPFHLVPEGSDEVNSHEANEEQLLYRVPVFDPFVGEGKGNNSSNVERLHGYVVPWDAELAEFAADVESLLGKGMENECVGMEELGLMEDEEYSWGDDYCDKKVVKVELEGESGQVMMELDDAVREPFELSFDYDYDDDEEKEKEKEKEKVALDADSRVGEIKQLLQLDYEGVITAWGSTKKSPWTTPHKPTLDLHHCLGSCGKQQHHHHHHPYGEFMGGYGGCHHPVITMGDDRGREARVSRYREKRRTRLFSKKIRYEVRKLNAEKRPRMKGRFVKRAALAAAAPPAFPLLT